MIAARFKRARFLAAALLGAIASSFAQPAPAQDASSVAGNYCLVGVREVGSCLRLSPQGQFEYFLAYGAYDENSEGTWKLEGGQVVLDSLAYDRRPTFSLKRTQASADNAFDVIVENKTGRPLSGFNVRVTCDGRTTDAGVTGAGGFRVACTSAPTAIALGVEMYNLAYRTFDVSGRAGADKTYVFEFDAGDLGRKKFVAHPLQLTPEGLTMTYADTPIRELEGRTFTYVRQ